MGKYQPQHKTGSPDGTEPLVQLWLLRLLIRLEVFKKNFCKINRRYPDDELVYSLGEIFAIDVEDFRTEEDDIDYKEVFKRLDRLYATTEKKLKNATAPECLAGNIQRLSALAGCLRRIAESWNSPYFSILKRPWKKPATCLAN